MRSYQGLEGIRDSRNFNLALQTLRGVAAVLQLHLPDLIAEASTKEIQGVGVANAAVPLGGSDIQTKSPEKCQPFWA